MYIEIVSKHSNNINRGLRDTVVNKSGDYNVKWNDFCPALTTYIAYLMNNTVILNTAFVVSSFGCVCGEISAKQINWSLLDRGNISMSIYYWLDELEFRSQNPGNIRIRDL